MDTPTAPFVALVESDGVDNDDWVTDHDDPDNIDWSTMTEGLEAIVIVSTTLEIQANTGVKVDDIGAGISYDQKYGKRGYGFVITGYVTSLTAANYLDKFCMDNRHTTGTDFSRPYLVICQAANTYKQFTDESNARKDYTPCNTIQCRLIHNDANPTHWNFIITGRSVWR